jgi:TatD DNase family protein
MTYVDTHCHIHDSEFAEKFDVPIDTIVNEAAKAGVEKLICVGTDQKSSLEAAEFCKQRQNCHFSVALHPHEAANNSLDRLKKKLLQIEKIIVDNPKKLVAIGECGLDYYYHKDKNIKIKQKTVLKLHIELAQKYGLPLIFHIRDAFDDFFEIVDEYEDLTGVVHSFCSGVNELEGVTGRGFYVGLNGIMTFTKDDKQLEAAKLAPIEKIIIETDSPFLTPAPLRGTINQPKHVILITKFLSELRGDSQAFLAKQTTENAKKLFNL